MYGYWNPECPGGTNNSAVPMTVYVCERVICLSIANWKGSGGEGSCAGTIVNLDCERLGIKQDYTMYAPAIKELQDYAEYRPGDLIDIEQGKGIILVIDRDSYKI